MSRHAFALQQPGFTTQNLIFIVIFGNNKAISDKNQSNIECDNAIASFYRNIFPPFGLRIRLWLLILICGVLCSSLVSVLSWFFFFAYFIIRKYSFRKIR